MKSISLKSTVTKAVILGALIAPTVLPLAAHANEGSSVVATENAKQVNTFEQLKAALADASVSAIEVTGDITFPRAITGVPIRDVKMYSTTGAKIDLGKHYIHGKISSKEKGTFTLEGVEVVGYRKLATFFKGSNGWDFVSKDNTFDGETLVQLNNGTLTFEGTNTIDAEDEIGWVAHVVFKEGSELNGIAANSGHDRSAFKFKGTYENGWQGTVTVESTASVILNVKNQARSAFNGKINQINLQSDSRLKIETEGTGLAFDKSIHHKTAPVLNVGENADLDIHSKGASKGIKPTIDLAQPGSQINVAKGAYVYITGEGTQGIVFSAPGSSINVNEVVEFELGNKTLGSPVFSTKKNQGNLTFAFQNQDKIEAYSDYNTLTKEWSVTEATTSIANGSTQSVDSAVADFNSEFQVQNFGRIIITQPTT
ncbi:hypothetical protein UAW_01650 [Enterococcus haemoperoxidus ATCC BAA-382]|uniref:WxL domain-containing protein n=1 Tax=Enterococcus haemoperoxidus ATCC BAA-382 TaxID=1158608 RepID=R2QPI6_9ENTE|nr:pectate lyase-like adhesive domain-containing protein [Enterococcus haemoperoxidus]EOH97168.1 hypothetical protein UAW_01650 [Enterococcus haemoperoxidus ATCC BAA-382]EOT59981.1 hypothetical protein I583_02616 [Enterococcus haemoperoxidus ATCC BAA-382]OJG56163.1 hypothetical protein RV06_GL000279 [Enterococcus haemoperoxidus]